MKSSDIFIGVGLVILGLLFLSENFGYLRMDYYEIWPVFVILGGCGFWIGYIQNKKNYGLIMPGTILVVYGIMFFYCSVEGWYYMQVLWPGFLIGPGVGFYFMYLLGEKERGLLLPATILCGLGVLFFMGKAGIWRYWPALLIVFGLYLIIKHYVKKDKKSTD